MNLFASISLYGEGPVFTLPDSAAWHNEKNVDPKQQLKRREQVGGVVADAAGTQTSGIPDLYNVVDTMGRLLHKDLSYEDAKRASEARRYAKVIPARGREGQNTRRIEPDKGKRIPSKIERKIIDRRSMHTPDTDWAQGAQ